MNVVVHGSYFANNFGDVLLWQTTVDWVRQQNPEAVIYHAGMPKRLQPIYVRGEVRSYSRSAGQIDALIISGGGYLSPPRSGAAKWSVRAYARHRRALALSRKARSVLMVGVGAGPFEIPILRQLVKPLSDQTVSYKAVLLRDAESVQFWNQPSLALPVARQCYDIALLSLVGRAAEFQSGTAAIPAIHCDFGAMSKRAIERFDAVLHALLLSYDGPLKVLVDCPSKHGLKTMSYYMAKYGNRIRSVVFDGDTTEFLKEIATSSWVLTSKLHVGICAVALDVPTIALPSHHKTQRFYKQIGGLENCIRPEDDLPGDSMRLLQWRMSSDLLRELTFQRQVVRNLLSFEASTDKAGRDG